MPYITCQAGFDVCCDTAPNGDCCTRCENCVGSTCTTMADNSGCRNVPYGICCSNVCYDSLIDNTNCGTCGNTCNVAGGWGCCYGVCVDHQTNSAHCGGCDISCGVEACVGGVCIA